MTASLRVKLVAGVDEAGRGPLAGAVVAAAVILDNARPIAGLTDSKMLSAVKRSALEDEIKRKALAWAVADASIEEIDQFNILQASLMAMKRAVLRLQATPDLVLIDGNRLPDLPRFETRAIIKGDLSQPCISAASILAKEHRDRQMMVLDRRYPQYQFARHKGYPTRLHRELLKQYGACAAHRRSFRPVREVLSESNHACVSVSDDLPGNVI
ncbi:MAG: ribonuclease HII [Gammaproteobacteria bacterium]